MDCGNEVTFVAPDIEHRLVLDLISTREQLPQLGEIGKPMSLHHPVPML